jgi:hypothetical protein
MPFLITVNIASETQDYKPIGEFTLITKYYEAPDLLLSIAATLLLTRLSPDGVGIVRMLSETY